MYSRKGRSIFDTEISRRKLDQLVRISNRLETIFVS